MPGEEHPGLHVVVQEVGREQDPPVRSQRVRHAVQDSAPQEPPPPVAALRPRVREVDVENVDGAGRQLVQDRLGAVVDHEGVGESAPLDLVLRLLAATLLEIDPQAHAVRPGRGVVGQKNTVAAADLDLQPASGGGCQRRPQHPRTAACRVRVCRGDARGLRQDFLLRAKSTFTRRPFSVSPVIRSIADWATAVGTSMNEKLSRTRTSPI